MHIWFWQLIISPHMADLAKSLAERGHSVTFIAERAMSAERAAQGWTVPDVGTSKILIASDNKAAAALAETSPIDSIHICQGVRANGMVGAAQRTLKALGRQQFVIMETVDDRGWKGFVKRAVYKRLFRKLSPHLAGVLTNGKNTRDWVMKRGVPASKIFPFAYFLPEPADKLESYKREVHDRFRVLFVGQFIELKRLDLLIRSISQLDSVNVELAVVGSGPFEDQLKSLAEHSLPGRVDWIGGLPIDKVRMQMGLADCLVLPSRHDGWGAVISEALMSGTPVICSDACGAAVVVEASGHGGVFRSGSVEDLKELLNQAVRAGRLTDQQSHELAAWSRCLGGPAGASYLEEIIGAISASAPPPMPPWCSSQPMRFGRS